MADYILKIVKRRKRLETFGFVTESIGLEATDPDAARQEAIGHLAGVNWDAYFAGLQSEDGSFVTFWASKPES